MKIVWFTWKDRDNPEAGGAELVNEELAKKLVREGNQVHFIVAGFKNSEKNSIRDGFKITRLGNKYTIYFLAFLFFRKNLLGWPDLVIDECNTVPFFAKFYVKCNTIFIIQQFAREIWFYQMPALIAIIGYIIEPFYLKLFKDEVTITFAKSTKNDLVQYGFKSNKVFIISEIFTMTCKEEFNNYEKNNEPTILFFSAFRKMKRPHHVIQAFEIAKISIPALRLEICGSGNSTYAKNIVKQIEKSPFKASINYHGPIYSEATKALIMQRAHYICCSSVREGWGIIVSEAGVMETPAIVYDVNGLKDAVDYGDAGLIAKINSPQGLADAIIEAVSYDSNSYKKLQLNAFKFAKKVNLDNCYNKFTEILKIVNN